MAKKAKRAASKAKPKKKCGGIKVPFATITFTKEEAHAVLGGVVTAIREVGEPPKEVAQHLADALDKFMVAFGIPR